MKKRETDYNLICEVATLEAIRIRVMSDRLVSYLGSVPMTAKSLGVCDHTIYNMHTKYPAIARENKERILDARDLERKREHAARLAGYQTAPSGDLPGGKPL